MYVNTSGADAGTDAAAASSYTWTQSEPLPEGVGADYSTHAVDASGGLYDLLADESQNHSTSKSNNLSTFKENFEQLAQSKLKRRPSSFRYNPSKFEPPVIRVRYGTAVVEFGTLDQDGDCDILYAVGYGSVEVLENAEEQLFDPENPPKVPLVHFPGETLPTVIVKAKAVRKRDGKVSDSAVFARELPGAKQLPLPKVILNTMGMTVTFNATVDGARVYYNWTSAPAAPTQTMLGAPDVTGGDAAAAKHAASSSFTFNANAWGSPQTEPTKPVGAAGTDYSNLIAGSFLYDPSQPYVPSSNALSLSHTRHNKNK